MSDRLRIMPLADLLVRALNIKETADAGRYGNRTDIPADYLAEIEAEMAYRDSEAKRLRMLLDTLVDHLQDGSSQDRELLRNLGLLKDT